MKHILLFLISSFLLFGAELSYDPMGDKEEYLKGVDKNTVTLYKKFNKLFLAGEVLSAKKIADDMMINSRSLDYNDTIGTMISELASAKTFNEIGENRKSKFLLNSALTKLSDVRGLNQVFLYLEAYPESADYIDPSQKKELYSLMARYTGKHFINEFKNKDDFYLLNYYTSLHSFLIDKNKKTKDIKRISLENTITTRYTKKSWEYNRLLMTDVLEYMSSGNTITAIQLLEQIKLNILELIKLNKYSLETNTFMGDIYYQLGNAYSLTKDELLIEENYNKAISIFKSSNLFDKCLESYMDLSFNLKFINIKKAFRYIGEAEEFILENNDKESVEYGYFKVRKSDLYVANKKYAEALQDLLEAQKIFIDKFGEFSNEAKLIKSNIQFIEKTIEDIKWGI